MKVPIVVTGATGRIGRIVPDDSSWVAPNDSVPVSVAGQAPSQSFLHRLDVMYNPIRETRQTMRYPAEHKQQTRQRIVRAAARRFRSRGTEGATIGTLMRDLRLTHGGFYRHFGSKEQLFLESFEQSLRELSTTALEAVRNAPRGHEVKALIDRYLDTAHAGDVAGGCPVAALATEIARRPPKERNEFLRVLIKHIGEIAKYLPGATVEDREHKARVLFSGMAGTLNLARVIVDDRQRRRFLDDAKKFYLNAMCQ